MRRFLTLALLVAGLDSVRAQPARGAGADAELQRIRELVEAGALPRKALQDAEDAREEARDREVLRALLYGRLDVNELTEQQAREMVEAADRRLERHQRRLEAAKKRVELGVAPITSLTPFLEDLDAARRVRELALARARLLEELVSMVRAEDQPETADSPSAERPSHLERFDGVGSFSVAQFNSISAAFEKTFGKPLPVSAKGETALHRSWGLDHRGRVDVAVEPDSREGAWLRRYLEALSIPYLAFREARRGQATAAHIHIGPPSSRIRRAD